MSMAVLTDWKADAGILYLPAPPSLHSPALPEAAPAAASHALQLKLVGGSCV